MKSWSRTAVLALCLVLFGSVACARQDQNLQRQLVKVVRGDLAIAVNGNGNIDVTNEAKLSFGSGGKVDKIHVIEGDKVRRGQTLAKLETGALELALAQAQAAQEEAQYNLNQLKDVLHASYDRIQIAEAQLKAAKLGVAQAQKQLTEATITAPFDGVVAGVSIKEGDFVSPSTTIIHLVDPTSMEISVDMDEIDVPNLKIGQPAVISLDALPSLQLKGKVTSISPLPTPQAGVVLYKVKIGFTVPQDSGLKIGMSATADITTQERKNVLLVPDGAISQDGKGNWIVKVLVNEQIETRAVVKGISDDFQTEIISGLQEGDTVVVEKRS